MNVETVAVAAQVCLVILTWFYARSTRAMVREMQAERNERAMPRLEVCVERSRINAEPLFALVNVGSGVARDVCCGVKVGDHQEVVTKIPTLLGGQRVVMADHPRIANKATETVVRIEYREAASSEVKRSFRRFSLEEAFMAAANTWIQDNYRA